MRRIIYKIIISFILLVSSISMAAQTMGAYGDFSPYSVFGVGDIYKEGTTYNKSMGGVGIASRNHRYINYLNPAAVTARDSLAFMADFGLIQNNKIYSQGDLRSANNIFNLSNLILTVPIYKSSALMLGITPFSNMGYNFSYMEEDENIIGNTGNINHSHNGNGGIYQSFIGAGATFWDNLSVGAEFIYYFGNINKTYNVNYSNSSIRSINSGTEQVIRGITGKLGLQYEYELNPSLKLIAGATYRFKTNMYGETVNYEYANQESITDTISYNTISNKDIKIADELGLGVSVSYANMWTAEVNYLRSNWANTGIDKTEGFSNDKYSDFNAIASQSFKAGFEIVPNRNDIRYYMLRCAYRAGLYYNNEYYKFDGNLVSSMGLTLGLTLPIYKWYNGLSLGVDIGKRGSLRNNMVQENYFNFSIGFNIHDIWFQKPKYD